MSNTAGLAWVAAGATRKRMDAAAGVVICSASLVGLIVGVFVLLCLQGYDTTLQLTRSRVQNAADVVAETTRWILASAHAALEGVATQSKAAKGPLGSDVLSAFEGIASAGTGSLKLLTFDAAGSLIEPASTTTSLRNVSDQPLFAALAEGQKWALSAQVRDPETNEAAFFVARRLDRAGAFNGVAVLVVPAALLSELALSQDLGPGSTISIVRSDGSVVARVPPLANPLNLSGTPAFAELGSGQSGSYISAASPADGVPRIVGFRHVDELGYIAIAAVSKQTALNGLWNSIWIVSFLIGPIALAVLAGSLVTARLLRRTEMTSRSLASALERNDALFQEIHHRVKNNLQSVNALLRLQPISAELRDEMSNRIFAMSAVHEHIYRSHNFSTVSVREYLHTLVQNIRGGYRSDLNLVEDIDDLAIHRDLATPLGLIVNEVVANSFKHGFPDNRPGTVHISVKQNADGRACLNIWDDGVGFDPNAPSTGIGRRLIARFAAQLNAEMQHVGAEGARFTLIFPLEPQPAGAGA